MRTDKEIIERIKVVNKNDFFGWETLDLLCRLPFSEAKQFLKPEAGEEGWHQISRDREYVLNEMKEYMLFAWDKANNMRGISANRSISHFMSWIWLAGDDLGDLSNYQFYGKDELVRICEHYGWDASQWDDGIRTNG